MNKTIKSALLCVAALSFFSTMFAQEALKSTEEEYYDFLSLQGLVERPTLNYRTLSDSEWILSEESKNDERNIWKNNNLGTKHQVSEDVAFKIYGIDWYNSYNTAAPYGQNDGALWQGKGYNTSLSAGARLEAYGLELTFKPQISFSQNKEFDIMTSNTDSEYGYFWGYSKNVGVDLPQRFGDESFATFDWGDTEIRYTWKNLTAGFGTQAVWLGPAWLNPMLSSNNAATYPKFDIGLRKTPVTLFGWYAGDIEGRIWTGYLSESDYFDNDTSNDHNMINALSAAYAPSFIPGLTLGVNRVFVTKWETENIKYLGRLFSMSSSNTVEDQKASISADWLFPEVGFEVYGELGIDDYSSRQLANPFHTAIYTVGVKKTLQLLNKFGIYQEIVLEWNNFEMSQDFQSQWNYMGYYSHHIITQGYTQKGQIIGAGSGYYGNSQYLALKTYFSKSLITLFLHYSRPDNNYYYNKTVGTNYIADDETSWARFKSSRTYGINIKHFISSSICIEGEINTSFIINTTYVNGSSIRNNFMALKLKYQL